MERGWSLSLCVREPPRAAVPEMQRMTMFTGVLIEIADLCGVRTAEKIQAEFGGREMIVPAAPRRTPNAALCRLIGLDATIQIASEIGSGRFEVAIGAQSSWTQMTRDRARRIHERLQAGESTDQIAKAERCTRQTVKNHRRAHAGRTGAQPDLFEAG